MMSIDAIAWPADRLGEALTVLIRRTRLSRASDPVPNPSRAVDDGVGRWIEEAAATLLVDAEEVDVSYAELGATLRQLAPAIVRARGGDDAKYLVVRRSGRRGVVAIDPQLQMRSIPIEEVRALLAADLEAEALPHVEQLLDVAAASTRARRRARALLLQERLASRRVGGVWILRPSSAAGFWRQISVRRIPRLFALLIGGHTVQYALLVGSWWMIGRGMLHDQLSMAWLIAWALVLISAVPFRLLANWAAGRIGIELGVMLKRRLLFGALCLPPDSTRHQGIGELLGRVIESEAVETLALSGAVLGITATTEVMLAALVLALGAAPVAHGLLLVGALLTISVLATIYVRRLTVWTRFRLGMTNTLVERIIGHRTRLAQQSPDDWHEDEDRQLEAYARASFDADRLVVAASMTPRGWLVLAIACLLPSFVSSGAEASAIAVSLGGIVLAYRALAKMVPLVSNVAMTAVAWREVAPMLSAAQPDHGSLETFDVREARDPDRARNGRVIVQAEDLMFRYRRTGEPVLRGCNVRIEAGDRVLLEGASGGGKSTLGSLLAGLRVPDAGLLLVNGLDRGTLGQRGWRQRVVSAPQFHDNHVFSASFAFNLLMGRRWPPRAADLADAETICRELGLGDLIDRMPGGMLQMVGDMGWQLSHGERSRLFMARTLLQRADLIILDESFAALDPETLDQCAQCVFERAPALVVIAHP